MPSSTKTASANPSNGGASSENQPSRTAAAGKASPYGAAAVSAEFPLPPINTVCQGGLTIMARSSTASEENPETFLDASRNENQVAEQSPSRGSTAGCPLIADTLQGSIRLLRFRGAAAGVGRHSAPAKWMALLVDADPVDLHLGGRSPGSVREPVELQRLVHTAGRLMGRDGVREGLHTVDVAG